MKRILYLTISFLLIALILFLSSCGMKFRVSFDDGDKITHQDITEGGKASYFEPTKDGYIFLGWLTDDDELFDFESSITKNINLHASYQMMEWTVTFVIDKDDDTKNIIEKVNTNYYVKKPSDPVKEDYIFLGWLYNGNTFDFHTKVTSDMTITASFVKDSEYTPKLNITLNSVDGGKFNNISVRRLEKIGELPTPSKDGYNFIGWYAGEELVDENYIVKQIEDFTLVARYERNN